MKRFLAWVGIVLIAVAFLALVYCTATGVPANVILSILLLMILVPIIIYGFLVAAKAFSGKENTEETDTK